MAFDESNGGTGMVMPVAPAYGGGYGNQGGFFGGDLAWIILILLVGGGGWGFGGFGGGAMWPMMMGGMGGFGMDYLYPWLNNSQHISDGFRDQQISSYLVGLQNSLTSGFGDVQLGIAGINQNLCQTGNAVTGAVRDGFYSAEIAANGRHTANLQQGFALQSTMQQGFNANAAATADVKYTIATEACADRAALQQGIQTVLDKLCALELDGYKRENDQLRTQLNMANLAASQNAQTAELRTSQATVANQLVSELRSCPIPSQPVYGNTPIFTCNGNNGCGCNGVGFFAA